MEFKGRPNCPLIRRPRVKLGILLASLVILIIIITAAVVASKKNGPSGRTYNKDGNILLLVSLDGFRYDYLDLGITPNLKNLALNGVKATFMRPSFPTLTFPNHYTIVTGLYPESHGIVSNTFYDPEYNESFRYTQPTAKQSKWWGGEPIWVTAIKSGLRSASFFWPGSEVEIQGIRPTFWKEYDGKIPYSKRIDQVIEWMKLPIKERPSMITLYFDEPDHSGHSYGPFENKTLKSIQTIDAKIGELTTKLRLNTLMQRVNMVITSDHGMANLNCSKVVYLDVDKFNVRIVGRGTSSFLYTDSKDTGKDIFEKFKCYDANLRVYSKQTIPTRLHFANNRRIGDVTLAPVISWQVLFKNDKCYTKLLGSHGFDNILNQMKTIFIATGPDFKANLTTDHFQNTELYNLFADLLHVKPAPNNGSYGSLHHIFKDEFLQQLNHDKDEKKFTEPKYCLFPSVLKYVANMSLNCTNNCQVDLKKYQQSLNLTNDETVQIRDVIFPLSLPRSKTNSDIVVLTQKDYVTGYDQTRHIPSWVGYKLTYQARVNKSLNNSICMYQDVRLNQSSQSLCFTKLPTTSNFTLKPLAGSENLVHNENVFYQTRLVTNMVPQYNYFQRENSTWNYFENEISRNYAKQFRDVYVISGTIFDVDNDGVADEYTKGEVFNMALVDIAIPTHFYKIFIRCKNGNKLKNCSGRNIDTLSFIFPHSKQLVCEVYDSNEELLQYAATIRDIERMTGLSFFTLLKGSEQARVKARLNTDLWI